MSADSLPGTSVIPISELPRPSLQEQQDELTNCLGREPTALMVEWTVGRSEPLDTLVAAVP
jgi:hypothetical protein